jgi:hypothetical protein
MSRTSEPRVLLNKGTIYQLKQTLRFVTETTIMLKGTRIISRPPKMVRQSVASVIFVNTVLRYNVCDHETSFGTIKVHQRS